jgi:hypothetical protein
VRVLKEKDRILYDKLVRLAGGDSGIVIKVLSNPHRSSVDLKTAIREIEELRNTRKHAPFWGLASISTRDKNNLLALAPFTISSGE